MSDSITFLGTSDGRPSVDRFYTSVLLKLGQQVVLLDCGEPCSHLLKRRGIDFNSIDAVLISHTHSDHIGGFPMLIQSMWLEGRTRPLQVWMPKKVIKPLRTWMQHCFLIDSQMGFQLEFCAIEEGIKCRLGKLRMTAFRTSHLDSLRKTLEKKFPKIGFSSFCFLIEYGKNAIGYSADIGCPDDLLPLCKKPLNLLSVEMAHCAADATIQFLQNQAVDQIVFTHMNRDTRANLQSFRRQAVRWLRPRKVTLAKDGIEIPL